MKSDGPTIPTFSMLHFWYTDNETVYTRSEMTFKCHSRSSTMSSIITSPGLSTRDRKSRLHCFSDKNSWNNLEDRSRSLYNHSALAGFRLPSATVVSAEPFSHGTGTLRCLQKDTELCPFGETQIMSYIVESCPLTKLNGGLSRLGYTLWMKTLFRGWPVMVHDTQMRRRLAY